MRKLFSLVFFYTITSIAFAQSPVMVVHNNSDPALDTVTVWADAGTGFTQLYTDVAYRELATNGFNDLGTLANIPLRIAIVPNTGTLADTATTGGVVGPITLLSNTTYIIIANGDATTGLQVDLSAVTVSTAPNSSQVGLIAAHGSPDAPNVDLRLRSALLQTPYQSNVAYRTITPSLTNIPAAADTIDITVSANGPLPIFASFDASVLSGLGGDTVFVFASGNLADGSFGLFAATSSNVVAQLPLVANPTLQVIHNSPDPLVELVDIYVADTLVLDDFEYRNSSGVIQLPAGSFSVGFAASNSTSSADILIRDTLTILNGENYAAVATGITPLTPLTNYAMNPDMVDRGFTVLFRNNIAIEATNSSAINLHILHGSQDAPSVEIDARGVAMLVDSAAYLDFTDSINVPAADYVIDVQTADGNTNLFGYNAPLSTLGGEAAIVFASGFVNPTMNNNGSSFGLFAAFTDGSVVELPNEANIYNEDFTGQNGKGVTGTGTTTPPSFDTSGITWTIDSGANGYDLTATSDWFRVEDGVMEARDVDNEVIWFSPIIPNNAMMARDFKLSMDLYEDGTLEALDYIQVSYSTDSGSTFTDIVDVLGRGDSNTVNDDFDTVQISQTFSSSNPLQIRVKLLNNAGSEFLRFDNISLDTIAAPAAMNTKLMAIHNNSTPILDTVDIWLDAGMGFNPFKTSVAYRDLATSGFEDVSSVANIPIRLAIVPNGAPLADTSSTGGTVGPITLLPNTSYVLIVNGDAGTGLRVDFTNVSNMMGVGANDVGLIAAHGVSDAPAVDIRLRSALLQTPYLSGANYGAITNSITTIPNNADTIDITVSANGPLPIFASADASALSTLGGDTIVAFASGLVNDGTFQIWVATSSGLTVGLPRVENPNVQIIHNSPDPLVDTVDVYIADTLVLDDFAFRTSTGIVELPAGTFDVGFALSNSTSSNDIAITAPLTIINGQSYAVVANGITSITGTTGYQANPEGVSIAFTPTVKDNIAISETTGNNVNLHVHHGSPSAPSVEVEARGVAVIVDSAAYLDFTDSINVPAANYTLDVKTADGVTTVKSYTADLSTLGGGAAIVFASGYLDSTLNNNGPNFGLFAALIDGTVLELPEALPSSLSNTLDDRIKVYPNPADDRINIELPTDLDLSNAKVRLIDLSGKELLSNSVANNNSTITLDVNSVSRGVYMLQLSSDNLMNTYKVVIE